MAEAMDDRDATRLPTGRRREARKIETLEWWRDYRSKPTSFDRSHQVCDKGNGSNRYGVVPWDVSLCDQGSPVVGQQSEPEAVHLGYGYQQHRARRQRPAVRRRDLSGESSVV